MKATEDGKAKVNEVDRRTKGESEEKKKQAGINQKSKSTVSRNSSNLLNYGIKISFSKPIYTISLVVIDAMFFLFYDYFLTV